MPALLALRRSSRSISGSCIASAWRIGPLLATAWILIRSVQSTQPSLAPNLQCRTKIRCFEDLELKEGNVRLASQDQETAVRSEEADVESTGGGLTPLFGTVKTTVSFFKQKKRIIVYIEG